MDFCTQLSVNLLIDAFRTDNNTNLVLSPMSYNVILNLIAGGASENTLKEMLEFLGCAEIKDVNSSSKEMMRLASDIDENNGGGPVMHCLNGLWLDQDYRLNSSYEELASKIYNAHVKSADFENKADEVVKDVNAWAKESTKGLVREVLKKGDLHGTSIVLGNALYFKGNWESGFNPKYTTDKPFRLMNGRRISVPFMTGCENYSHGSFDGYEVVQIPYQKGEMGHMFSMYIFLPNARFGLEGLLQKVASDEVFLQRDFELDWDSSYDFFWIPKFKFSYYTTEGVKGMKKMGLKSPFDHSSVDGGLTEMVDERISVSRIVQKCFIEIDEKGTEAAAVTVADDEDCEECSQFVADHPFLFMIREDKSKFILFIGVVLHPSVAH